MVTLSPPTALPLAGETPVTRGAADCVGVAVGAVGDTVGAAGDVEEGLGVAEGGSDRPVPDGDTGDAQGCVAPISPPTP